MSVLLAEHRLERCLAAADRVVAMDSGSIAFDGAPRDFLAWAQDNDTGSGDPGGAPLLAGRDRAATGRGSRSAADAGGCGDRPPPRSTLRSRGGGAARADRRTVQAVRRASTSPRRQRSTFAISGSSSSGTRRRATCSGASISRSSRGERVALMGRNGAGKSTLLRDGRRTGRAGPRDRIEAPGGMALLTQNPGDYLVRERVGDELPGEQGLAALRVGRAGACGRRRSARPLRRRAAAAGAGDRAGGSDGGRGAARAGRPRRADPRDGPRPQGRPGRADRGARRRGARRSSSPPTTSSSPPPSPSGWSCSATASRSPTGPAAEILSGGWYFATEVARVLDLPGVITPEQGGRHAPGGARR